MDAIYTNSKNSGTSDSHELLLNLADKTQIKRNDKYVAVSNLSVCNTRKNIKQSYRNSKYQVSVLSQNKDYELPDGLYSVSDKTQRKD